MTMLLFRDAFWGSDFISHAGYDALIQRLRDGKEMCKDVEGLLKMRAVAEERYGKELLTIAHKARGFTEISTLRASFDELKAQIQNNGYFHIQLADMLREEVKKLETFRERQKEQRKKFAEIMEKVQKIKVSMFNKTMESKTNYEQRCREADKLQQEAAALSSPKHSERVHHKAKQSIKAAKRTEQLYITNVEKLETVRQDWEETHRSTCEVFQQMEMDRISMLRCVLWDHCNHFSMQCVRNDELYENVRKTLETCDITLDNNCFIETKTTGSSPPECIVFEDFYQRSQSEDRTDSPHFAGGGGLSSRLSKLLPGGTWCSNNNIDDGNLHSESAMTSSDHSLADNASETNESLHNFQQDASAATSSTNGYSYIVLYNYLAQDEEECSVREGEVVQVLQQGDDGWWTVERNGQTGLVPGSYLAIL
ncbi:proline-serine-threonine phosphatase-interacting protein 1-like isoform X1 [Lampris incognitus]|uniref:proline-serine-threonine phosphatase-interacting protein 1-like isoform X1 n=1 Tax=Lampris incognitus TaxID=2546036 RepID=UPI0024B51472|nr:proline-serine-threonine phosphatase-interacting protein 1-like isoform X1 [Lampris incognitus]